MSNDFKRISLSLVFTLIVLSVYAQEIVPLNRSYLNPKKSGNNSGKRTMQDPLTLPFFDDFSTSKDSVSNILWVKGGGTYLNNSSGLFPPSLNVITFDGYNASGQPYNISNSFISGPADTLTSHPINLGGHSASSGVYLSFLYQPEGLSEEPDRSGNEADSISLYFLDKDKVWKSIWRQSGESVRDFRNAIIPINDPSFLWDGFQFRLISFGNLSGPFDTWHLDYFYLDAGRNVGDTIRQDMTISQTPSTFLKRYSSLPYNQFLSSFDKEIKFPKLYVNNLHNEGLLIPSKISITEKNNLLAFHSLNPGHLVQKFAKDSIELPIDLEEFKSNLPVSISETDSLIMNLRYDVVSSQNSFYLRNDTINLKVNFKNYFAYDDGSAEAAFRVDGRDSKLAYEFEVAEADTLTAIDIHFPMQTTDLTGSSFRLMIWKEFSDKDSLIKGLSTVLSYSTQINGFTRYTIPVSDQFVVSDKFYVGYQQTGTDVLFIGFDKNTNSSNKIFYKIGNSSSPTVFDKYKGSLMIRPVFGKSEIITGTEKPPVVKPYTIYPNPTSGKLSITGAMENLKIYDPFGKMVFMDKLSKKTSNTFDFSIFSNGIYVFVLSQGKNVYTEKVLIEK